MSQSDLIPRVPAEMIWREVDENAVIVSPTTGEVRVLNEVGTLIWRLLVAGQNPAAILSQLVSRYQVAPAEAQADLDRFLADLTDRGLLVW